MINVHIIPAKQLLYQPTKDFYGKRLTLVFGNEFSGGKCTFYQEQCFHCDIGAGEGVRFTPEMNKKRLDFFKDYYGSVLPDVVHLLIYNSGNVLNPGEMSPETMRHVLDYAASLQNCKVISVDSREGFINYRNLERLVVGIRHDQTPRVVLGIESQDDLIRIGKLNKRITREAIERAFKVLGTYKGRIGIDINIVFQPPEIVGEEAIREAVATTQYGLQLSQKFGVPVDFNPCTYYPSLISRTKFPNHPRANLEDTIDALARMREVIDSRSPTSILFLGWNDEGHDQSHTERRDEESQYRTLTDRFNETQDVKILRR